MSAVALDDVCDRTGLPCVIADVGEATAGIIQRLRAMGHQRVAMVATTDRYPTMARRIEGYRRALADQAHDDRLLVHVGYSTLQQGQIATRQLMQGSEPPTAFIYATDCLAVGGMIELGRLGLSVPHDVSVVGHDNTALAREMDPALTTIDLNLPQMIARAFEQLRQMIEAGEPDVPEEQMQTNVDAKVVWRNSCGPVVAANS